ncbi:MAG: serine/threonine protein kinase [Marinilabiliales bacterium]|nr:MAG: serine/threonine protein kinase [Marinilabiliales bacterium]
MAGRLKEYDKTSYLFELCENALPSDWNRIIAESGIEEEAVVKNVLRLLENREEAEMFFERLTGRIGSELEAGIIRYSEGQIIDKFRIKQLLSGSRKASVYLAERVDGQIEQEVAIKISGSPSGNSQSQNRFRTEQQMLSRLNHPNIARFFDGGITDEGYSYLVMEYIDGIPVDAYCRESKLKLGERLKLFLQVCDAVQYAHDNKIIHKDIKPGNILVTSDGVVKLVDFGISIPVDENGAHSNEAAFSGTIGYSAPEQFGGGRLSTAMDVYQMGKVLYLLITGCNHLSPASQPREYDLTPETLKRFLKGTFKRRFSNMICRDMDALLCKALAVDPRSRYLSALALRQDIESILYCLPLKAREQTSKYIFGKYIRKQKELVIPIAAMAVNLISLLSVLVWQNHVNHDSPAGSGETGPDGNITRPYYKNHIDSYKPGHLSPGVSLPWPGYLPEHTGNRSNSPEDQNHPQ